MISFTKNNIIEHILGRIPEFNKAWVEFIDSWLLDPNERTVGLDIDCFVGFSLNAIKENNTVLIIRIFQTIEEILHNCDKELEDIIYLFYLENLTNNPEKVEKYLPLLGPKSKELCRELDKFWGTKTPGIYD